MKILTVVNKIFCPIMLISSMIDYFKGDIVSANHSLLAAVAGMTIENTYSKKSN